MPFLRIGKYELRMYASDFGERPHVHVRFAGNQAKYWIDRIELFKSSGYAPHELNAIERMLTDNQVRILKKWHEESKKR